jgi:hypothetical protein
MKKLRECTAVHFDSLEAFDDERVNERGVLRGDDQVIDILEI